VLHEWRRLLQGLVHHRSTRAYMPRRPCRWV
jgi:hypothetical protein